MTFRAGDIAEMLSHLGAQSATYNAATIQVILHQPPSDEGIVGELAVRESAPYVTCRTVDVPNAAAGESMDIAGTTWHFTEVRPDGTGVTRITVSKDL